MWSHLSFLFLCKIFRNVLLFLNLQKRTACIPPLLHPSPLLLHVWLIFWILNKLVWLWMKGSALWQLGRIFLAMVLIWFVVSNMFPRKESKMLFLSSVNIRCSWFMTWEKLRCPKWNEAIRILMTTIWLLSLILFFRRIALGKISYMTAVTLIRMEMSGECLCRLCSRRGLHSRSAFEDRLY